MNYRILFVQNLIKSGKSMSERFGARNAYILQNRDLPARSVTIPFGEHSLSENKGMLLQRSLQQWRNIYGLNDYLTKEFDCDTTLSERIFPKVHDFVGKKPAASLNLDVNELYSTKEEVEDEGEFEMKDHNDVLESEVWCDLNAHLGRCVIPEDVMLKLALESLSEPAKPLAEPEAQVVRKEAKKKSDKKPCDHDCDDDVSVCEDKCKKEEREKRKKEKANKKKEKEEDKEPDCSKLAKSDKENDDEECPCKEEKWKYPPKPKCPEEQPKRYERDKNRCPKKDRKCDCSPKDNTI